MAKYIGPKCKICRREGGKMFLKGEKCYSSKCPMEERAFPPGQHGQRRPRLTDYAVQLREKQKLRKTYGLLEKQFRQYYSEAARRKGSTGEILLQMLESRLDNLVYRMGFAASRNEARQLVRHNGILVDGKKVNIPSCQIKPDSLIAVVNKEQLRVKAAIEAQSQRGFVDWVSVDVSKFEGQYRSLPDRADMPSDINEHLVVELYSK